jgi:hypothetical protein
VARVRFLEGGRAVSTKERLAKVLEENRCPPDMVNAARAGYYDDFESPLAMPCVQLVLDLQTLKKFALAKRAREGEFDGTKEEADAWMAKEGAALLMETKGSA